MTTSPSPARRALLPVWLAALVLLVCGVPAITPSSAGAATPAAAFETPLLPGTGADPDIHTYNGKYYMLFNGDHSGTEVRMRVASSLAGLADGSEISVWSPPASMADICCHVGWGGYLFPYSGRWYIYMQGDDGDQNHGKSFVLESATADPTSTYTFKAYIPGVVNGLGYAAGPALVNSQLYMFQTYDGGIYAAKASDPWTVTTSWNLIAKAASSGWECANNRCIDEGSNVLVRGNKVYNVFSAGGYESPDYCVGLLTATLGADLTQASSWQKAPGCVFRRDDSVGSYGPGSMTWFTSPDGKEDWVAYHVKTTTGITWDGADRRLEAKRVTWAADGTPNFGTPQRVGSSTTLPSGDAGVPNSSAALTAINSTTLVLFSRTSTGVLQQRRWTTTGGWGAWSTVSNSAGVTGTGAAESRTAGVVDVFATRADGSVGHAYDTGGGFSGWENFGAPASGATSSPAAATWSSDRQSLYVRGSDNHIWEKWWTSSTQWSSWQDLGAPGGGALSSPAAVSRSTNITDLVVRTAKNAIALKTWNGSQWSSWNDLGAPSPGAVSAPTIASWGSDRLHVYTTGRDGQVWERYWSSGSGWSVWQTIGAPSVAVTSAPAAVSRANGITDVIVRGADGEFYRKTWNTSSWSSWTQVTAP